MLDEAALLASHSLSAMRSIVRHWLAICYGDNDCNAHEEPHVSLRGAEPDGSVRLCAEEEGDQQASTRRVEYGGEDDADRAQSIEGRYVLLSGLLDSAYQEQLSAPERNDQAEDQRGRKRREPPLQERQRDAGAAPAEEQASERTPSSLRQGILPTGTNAHSWRW